jgi:hypothetical protein
MNVAGIVILLGTPGWYARLRRGERIPVNRFLRVRNTREEGTFLLLAELCFPDGAVTTSAHPGAEFFHPQVHPEP